MEHLLFGGGIRNAVNNLILQVSWIQLDYEDLIKANSVIY